MSSTDLARSDLFVPAANAPAFTQGASTPVGDVNPTAAVPPAEPKVRWHLLTRFAFRFTVLYVVMYTCTKAQLFRGVFSPILQLLPFNVPSPSGWGVVQSMANHIAITWWGYAEPVRGWHQGGGDKPFDWALNFGLVLLALGGMAVWSALDWKRVSYPRLHTWFRLFLRLGLGSQMVGYGFAKAFPMQMPFPGLTQLMSPYGNQGLMQVLWSKIGSSPSYEIFTGCAELLAGILLLIPGLTTIGALIAIPVTFQVWILNMTYDVPVKNLSGHLLIMAGLLLLPELKRLGTVLVLKRPTEMWREARYFRNVTAHRVVIGLQALAAVWAIYSGFTGAQQGWKTYPYNQPKPPLYGVWNIDRMLINGVERAPRLDDYDRWRRIVVSIPHSIAFQRMNDSYSTFPARVDLASNTIRFTTDVPSFFPQPPNTPKPPVRESGQMTITRPAPDKLILEGTLNGKQLRLDTTYWDPTKNFRLMQARFRWVQ